MRCKTRVTHLSVVDFAGAEQCGQRVVAGNDEAGDVDKKGTGNVEKNEEEVEARQSEHGVDLGHRRLLFEVVEGGVFGQLENTRHQHNWHGESIEKHHIDDRHGR